jgi:hypothetical protein
MLTGPGVAADSIPHSFAIPQAGSVSFRCGSGDTTVQPFCDGHGTGVGRVRTDGIGLLRAAVGRRRGRFLIYRSASG